MGSDSKILWTRHTFSPWWGCKKVSDACKNCYVEGTARRTAFAKHAFGPRGVRYVVSERQWKEPIKWNAAAAAAGRPALVFCGSMCDVFEDRVGSDGEVLDEQRDRLWNLINQTPDLRWMLLTKRPENVRWLAPAAWLAKWPAHVAVGTTIENQETCEARLLRLLSIPAAMRFVSCEPLLGRVWLPEDQRKQLDWVITGGESGGKARPSHPDWFRSLRDQCAATNTPFMFKQGGEYVGDGRPIGKKPWVCVLNDGTVYRPKKGTVPSDEWLGCQIEMRHKLRWLEHQPVAMTRVGKKAAGRELDGVEYAEFPEWAERGKAEG